MLHPEEAAPVPSVEPTGRDRILTFFAAIAMVTVLYVARDVFVPIAVAVLLAFVLARVILAPVILVLRTLRLPRT